MDYSYRAEKANDYDYPPVGGHPQDEPYGETIARLRDLIQYKDVVLLEKLDEIKELRAENAQLKDGIAALETEHIPAPDCEHGLPRDCCKICAEARERGRRIEWTANVRAGGEYQE